MGDRKMTIERAGELTVGEVMIPRPKTLSAEARVADVRQSFERPSVRTVLLADGERFVGAIDRDALPDGAADEHPARDYVDTAPVTATAAMPMSEAVRLLSERGQPRLIVLDEDGSTLRGLLCANDGASSFCVR
jgi:CBS domain-containing protein